jgi:hypothetical protein
MSLVPSSVKRSEDVTGDDILTFTTAGSKLVQVVADLAGYATNDLEEATATMTYIGKQRADGAWLVVSMDTTTGIQLRYATVTNNAAVLTYAASPCVAAGDSAYTPASAYN